MDNVITFKSTYRLCDELPDGPQAHFLRIIRNSGDGRVLRNAIHLLSSYGNDASGEWCELRDIGCQVTLRGRYLDRLFENMVNVMSIYEFDPHRHQKVSPWEPCVESITIEDLPIADRDQRIFLDQVRVARAERYRKLRITC